MKRLLILAFFILYASAFKLDLSESQEKLNNFTPKIRAREYEWLLDIPRILIEYLLIAALSPLFLLPSLFLNNQEIWIASLYKFMYLPYIRLSGFNS